MNRFRESMGVFWLARAPRERALLAGAAGAILLGLIYLLLVAPALTGCAELEKKLPVMRQQMIELRSLVQEAIALADKKARPFDIMTKERIEASLAAKGLQSQSITLSATQNITSGGDFVTVKLSDAAFSSVLDWLDSEQSNDRLVVIDANIVGLNQADRVNAAFTLKQAKNE